MWYGLYVSLSFFSPSPCLLTVPGNLGCFKDSGDPPTLSGTSETSNKLTIQNCISFCRKQRYKVGRFFSNVSRVYFIMLRKFDCLPLTGGKSLQSITRVMSEMDTSCPSWCSSFYVNHLHLQAISWQLLSWCPAQSMPSLFSHQASCFKPTSGWQIIVAIKADSWKWMVISPVGTSSSMHFAHLWVWHAIVPATNSARCSFSVSADPVQLRLHWQTLTAPPPPHVFQQMLQDVAADWHRLPTLGLSLSLMRMWKRQCSEVQIPCGCLTKSMPDELDSNPSLVCSARRIHVGVHQIE